jgi:hypothetical protein
MKHYNGSCTVIQPNYGNMGNSWDLKPEKKEEVKVNYLSKLSMQTVQTFESLCSLS